MIKELLMAFKARDAVSPSLARIAQNSKNTQSAVGAAFKAMGGDANKAASVFKNAFSAGVMAQVAYNGIIRASNAIKGSFASAIEYSSSVIESQNIVNTVFGESVNQINEFAEVARKQFGLTEREAKQFTGNMGSILSSMGLDMGTNIQMTKGLTALSADLASFYNLTAEEAFDKLRSGMSGQTEPLMRLGINMTQSALEEYAKKNGFKGSVKDLDTASKALLRYNYILENTRQAQGDFGKPIESWAVSSKLATNALEEAKDALKNSAHKNCL